MGKRVKKNRRVPPKEKKVVAAQSPKVIPQENNASFEKVDDGVAVVKERKSCPHLDKGIYLDKLLAKLRSSGPIRCEDCREGGNDRRGSKGKGKHGKKKGSASVDSKSESKAIWVCLECGHFVCAGVGLPTASTTHAIRHIRQTRHHLMIQWDNPQLRWCFACSTFIPVEKTEENVENKDALSEVVKLIKERSSEPPAADVENVWFGSGSVTNAIKSEGTISNGLDEKSGYMVRGLVNLGNTCFFNSVMQNLLALDRLRDYFLNLDASGGQLTISLKKLFAETKPEMGLKNAINPKPFFGCICAKAPQFRGYQQHDSHELLRCLLDGLYTEELALKKHINASINDVVSANQDLTFVDAVFGGQISSTLCCEECGHSSTVYEPFLDLSLPVPTKKTPSKKAQPVSRAKKTKLPPKKVGRARGKVNKDVDRSPAQGVTTSLPSSESPGLGHMVVPQTETMVASSSDSLLSGAVGTSAEANELSSASQNLLAVAESENEQVMENAVKENTGAADDFAWMDYLVMENTLQENAAGADGFTWMDYLEPGTIAVENDLISQNNDISFFQDSEDKNLVLNEALAESSQVSLLEGEPNWKPHDSSGNLQEEGLPLLVQDSEVLLLPYKEESTSSKESVRENEASSSNVGHGQEEVEFDGFGDMFNEPEIAEGPSIGPSLANEVAETGFLAGNISDSDPDEVDDSDSPVSVESCLAHFIKPELLSDDNAWNCENCAKILRRQKLESKKKQTKMSKNLTNGGETQSQCEPPSLDKEFPCPNGVRTISNGDISNSGESLVLHNKITDSLKQNGIKLEIGQTGELNSVVSKSEEGKSEIEDASLMKSGSSVSSKSCGQEESGGIQPVDSCNVENHSDNDKFQQSNSQMAENCQSGESEDEEIDSKNVKVKRNATKRVLINKAPPILTIHLKRFSQDARGRLSKLNGHVNFRETIDLRPYVDARCEDIDNCIYHLMGVVEHSGTMRGGHYIAYVRGGEKRKGKAETEYVSSPWYYVSDHYVRQVSLEEVLRCEAYILFYEKI
ncbi:PREDICTED: ubiquitin carboxyl-terminal hydrolase 2 [Theobroma cacao]|uniref:ubiquitinyl hydrolase 1 n=1 Tax=Theobroma cacao TaxID=3641 RepID=A0AB32WC80_THECC|nr:PREDICTED: ubiquitin carboxyl-terminal hydrolase 2 [Theobroma cacao]